MAIPIRRSDGHGDAVYTVQSLNHMIYDAVGGIKERTLSQALHFVYGELLEHGDHRALWELLGKQSLYEVEMAGRLGRTLIGTESATPQQPGTSWRDKYKGSVPESPWCDVIWPIGSTGERKALREWTAADLKAAANHYRTSSETMARKAKAFIAAALAVGNRTVGEAMESLPDETKKFFEELTGKSA